MTVGSKIKNCKVIATYFGVRRHYPYDCNDTIQVLKDSIQNEIELDPGVDNLDVILVNHDCGVNEGNRYLQSLDGKEIFCGTVRVVTREWDDGKGISLGSFDYAFKKLQDEYDYWFFQEDDYKLIKPNYYINGVKIMEEDSKVGFVGYDMKTTINSVKNQQYIELKIAQILFYIPILIWGYGKYLKRYSKKNPPNKGISGADMMSMQFHGYTDVPDSDERKSPMNQGDIKQAPSKLTQAYRRFKNDETGPYSMARNLASAAVALAPIPSLGKINAVKKS
jgi:hypothetical protein